MPLIGEVVLVVLLAAAAVAVAVLVRRQSAARAEIARLRAAQPAPVVEVSGAVGERRRELLDSVFMALGDACLLVDSSLVVELANGRVRAVFGGGEPLVGKGLQEVIGDHRIVDLARRSLAMREEVEDTYELHPKARPPGGGRDSNTPATRFVSVNVAPVRVPQPSEGGRADEPHLRLVIRDITELRETEQIRKDFVANASHELRTPLSIINGYIENLLDGLVEGKENQRRALQTMQKHGDRIARIVEDMLTISKFESVHGAEAKGLRSGTFDLAECLRDVIDRLAPLIDRETVKLETAIDADAREFAGDRFYWDQVIFNLVENALKENAGRPLRVVVSARRGSDGSHTIRVSDNGVGIPSADVPYVFKRFYRVAKHHSQSVKGTGLGLSIVKRAVEAHGGTISLASTPGVETEFTIMVPPPPNRDSEPSQEARPAPRGVAVSG